MSLNDVTAVDLAGTDTAVVRALGTGETALGPAVGPAVGVEESVLLLETEPEVLVGMSLHQTGSLVTVVELVGRAIRVPGLAEDEDVVTLAEGVREDSNRANVDIRVVTRSLASGRAVKVPLRKLISRGDGLRESLSKRPGVSIVSSFGNQVFFRLGEQESSLALAAALHPVRRCDSAYRTG